MSNVCLYTPDIISKFLQKMQHTTITSRTVLFGASNQSLKIENSVYL